MCSPPSAFHGNDATARVLAKVKTRTGPLMDLCARRPAFGGKDPPAAVFFYSPDRRGEHLEGHLTTFTTVLQADAYAGFDST
jgi:hypothetical protein